LNGTVHAHPIRRTRPSQAPQTKKEDGEMRTRQRRAAIGAGLVATAIAIVTAACGGGSGSSLEAQLSEQAKLEITACKKETDSILALPNTQVYMCNYKDRVTGELNDYIAHVDADGKVVSGMPFPG
jgi:hypothetical protein